VSETLETEPVFLDGGVDIYLLVIRVLDVIEHPWDILPMLLQNVRVELIYGDTGLHVANLLLGFDALEQFRAPNLTLTTVKSL
jgi:hypothetical protein